MAFSERFIAFFRKVLPSPFTLAILLSLLTFLLAYFWTNPSVDSEENYVVTLLEFWETGLWSNGVFMMQMMLILVLGHVLALSKPVDQFINLFLSACNTTGKAALWITFFTLMVSFFNWGLGLIFGAIFARKVGEYALKKGLKINYGIVGAAGYSGLMIWHGGISGSSLIKVAEPGHLKDLMTPVFNEVQLASLPDKIRFDQTVFSGMNITITLLLFILLPLSMYWLGKRISPSIIQLELTQDEEEGVEATGAEKLDYSKVFAWILGGFILLYSLYTAFIKPEQITLDFINPNYINLFLLGAGIVLHAGIHQFTKGVEEAIKGASGILIQFPIYFGIMGIMTNSGLVNIFSDFFVRISTEVTYPIYTFFSAGLVNFFVPSGGGQWLVQGPIIIKAAMAKGIPLQKSIMALAYGDQLTNMMQPFWALPLLGITGLKAKDILPYTLFLMLIGSLIFVLGLTLLD